MAESEIFWLGAGKEGHECGPLQAIFDAEASTPELIDRLAADVPQIRQMMARLRTSLPLAPHSGIGAMGRFHRLPNHYRSVNFLFSPAKPVDAQSWIVAPDPAAIVFKGTEPLLADFPSYLDWMLDAPFRSSSLPLGLHFALQVRLPPAAMWIGECIAEQAVTSKLQQLHYERHGSLARLPVPLFVFKLTSEQVSRYEEVVRNRLSAEAFKRIEGKIADGLGIEVYYYPALPVRAADLLVGNVKDAFSRHLTPERVEATIDKWSRLLAEMLCMNYMPYAPWQQGMGACVDTGNACLDGGFCDLLTLVPFGAIPDELFHRSLIASIQVLGDSVSTLSAASVGVPSGEQEAGALAAAYVSRRIRQYLGDQIKLGHTIDERLKLFLDGPKVSDIAAVLRSTHGARSRPAQFVGRAGDPAMPRETMNARVVTGY